MGLVWQAKARNQRQKEARQIEFRRVYQKGIKKKKQKCINVCIAYVYMSGALKPNNEKHRTDPDVTSIQQL